MSKPGRNRVKNHGQSYQTTAKAAMPLLCSVRVKVLLVWHPGNIRDYKSYNETVKLRWMEMCTLLYPLISIDILFFPCIYLVISRKYHGLKPNK